MTVQLPLESSDFELIRYRLAKHGKRRVTGNGFLGENGGGVSRKFPTDLFADSLKAPKSATCQQSSSREVVASPKEYLAGGKD